MNDNVFRRSHRYTWLCCLSLVFTTGLFSQTADFFSPATIVLRDGTERSGAIDYDGWERTPDAIRFRGADDPEIQTYGPRDLRRFAVAGLR